MKYQMTFNSENYIVETANEQINLFYKNEKVACLPWSEVKEGGVSVSFDKDLVFYKGQKEHYYFKLDKVKNTGGEESSSVNPNEVVSPIPGTVVKLVSAKDDEVKKGQLLLIVEAMKMQYEICAEKEGVLKDVLVSEGQGVALGERLVLFKEES